MVVQLYKFRSTAKVHNMVHYMVHCMVHYMVHHIVHHMVITWRILVERIAQLESAGWRVSRQQAVGT